MRKRLTTAFAIVYNGLTVKRGIKRYEVTNMKLYATKQELYDDCMKSEAGITVIAVPVYSEDDGEFLGYKKYVV